MAINASKQTDKHTNDSDKHKKLTVLVPGSSSELFATVDHPSRHRVLPNQYPNRPIEYQSQLQLWDQTDAD